MNTDTAADANLPTWRHCVSGERKACVRSETALRFLLRHCDGAVSNRVAAALIILGHASGWSNTRYGPNMVDYGELYSYPAFVAPIYVPGLPVYAAADTRSKVEQAIRATLAAYLSVINLALVLVLSVLRVNGLLT